MGRNCAGGSLPTSLTSSAYSASSAFMYQSAQRFETFVRRRIRGERSSHACSQSARMTSARSGVYQKPSMNSLPAASSSARSRKYAAMSWAASRRTFGSASIS